MGVRTAWLGLPLGIALLEPSAGCGTTGAAPLTHVDRELLGYDSAHSGWPSSSAAPMEALATGPMRETQLEIAEAVLRRLADHNESAAGSDALAHCVQLFGQPPPRQLLARLVDRSPRMRRPCEATRGRVTLWVDEIRLVDDHHAEASAGYYAGTLSGSSHSYWLVRGARGWVVVGDRLGFIS